MFICFSANMKYTFIQERNKIHIISQENLFNWNFGNFISIRKCLYSLNVISIKSNLNALVCSDNIFASSGLSLEHVDVISILTLLGCPLLLLLSFATYLCAEVSHEFDGQLNTLEDLLYHFLNLLLTTDGD